MKDEKQDKRKLCIAATVSIFVVISEDKAVVRDNQLESDLEIHLLCVIGKIVFWTGGACLPYLR